MSAEDSGAGLKFCVFAYNVQPYIDIDYSTGANSRSETAPTPTPEPTPTPTPTPKPKQETPVEKPATGSSGADYIGNKSSKKFHYPSCSSVDDMKESNKYYYTGSRDGIISQGYKPCKRCSP